MSKQKFDFLHAVYDRETGNRLLAIDVLRLDNSKNREDGFQIEIAVSDDEVFILQKECPDPFTGSKYYGHESLKPGQATNFTLYNNKVYINVVVYRDRESRLSYTVKFGSYKELRHFNRGKLGQRHGSDYADLSLRLKLGSHPVFELAQAA